ncbi:hypothetical protein BY996DRAFT_6594986 [Phakopsora pachyrhizi]|nr:hypothetical protein BY996DRAFT_6594986 [Phakopsora pachyrhizi]
MSTAIAGAQGSYLDPSWVLPIPTQPPKAREILVDFEHEGVTMGIIGGHHWKEEQKLGGCACQGQSDWSKTTGAPDL